MEVYKVELARPHNVSECVYRHVGLEGGGMLYD